MSDKIQIMELFGATIQGEGIMTGTITHFLRTGGCSLRCSWCDSLFAVLPAEIKKHRKMMSVGEIYDALTALPWAPYVTFTGGDPCIQERLGDIITRLNIQANMRVAVETQGMYFPDWLSTADVITFSPKGPSSGNIVDITDLTAWLKDHYKRSFQVCIKVVCFDKADYNYALDVYCALPSTSYDAFYFTAGTPMDPKEHILPEDSHPSPEGRAMSVLHLQQDLAAIMLKNDRQIAFNEKVHLGCQQHVLLWPDKNKGV